MTHLLIRVIAIVVFVAWLVAAWAMIKMLISGAKTGEPFWYVKQSVINASYNTKLRRIFAACIMIGVAAVIAFNAFIIMGYISPPFTLF
jgi:hypothetical protein